MAQTYDGFRRRKAQNVGYDEEEMTKMQGKQTNSVKDNRVVLFQVPSLSKWALSPSSDEGGQIGGDMKQRVVKFIHELLASMVFMWFVIFSVYISVDTSKLAGTTTGTATGVEFGTETETGTAHFWSTAGPSVFVNNHGNYFGIEQLTLNGHSHATIQTLNSIAAGLIQGFGICLAIVASGFWSWDMNPTWTFVTMFFPRRGATTPDGRSIASNIGTNVITGLIKILGQHIGFFAGGLLAWLVLSTAFPASTPAQIAAGLPGVPGMPFVSVIDPTVPVFAPTTTQAFVFEMLGSMMLGLLMMIIQFNPSSTLSKFPQITMAFVHTAMVIIGYRITGASYNWGRYFGQATVAMLAGGVFGTFWWLFLLAPLAGHVLAAFLYIFVFNF